MVSTALQMSLLNCCVTVGQQICTVALAGIEGRLSLEAYSIREDWTRIE